MPSGSRSGSRVYGNTDPYRWETEDIVLLGDDGLARNTALPRRKVIRG